MHIKNIVNDQVQLVVESRGEGLPVVLLHGLTATRHYVVMGSRLLERSGHLVISYDARGHGESAPAHANHYSYQHLADDLAAVLDAYEVDKAVLVGVSMGAHTVLRFALDHPGRVLGQVIVTPAFNPDAPAQAKHLEHWQQLSDGLRTGGVAGFLAAYGEPQVPDQWKATVAMAIQQRLQRHRSLAAVADALCGVPRSAPFQAIAELGKLSAPTVIVASRDSMDSTHPYAVAELYADSIPGARLLVEAEGKAPLAWQGGQLSRVISELTAQI